MDNTNINFGRQATCAACGALAAFAMVAALASAGTVRAAPPADAPLAAALQAALQAPAAACGEPHLDGRRLAPFYSASDATPLWVGEGRPNRRANLLLGALHAADQEGLPVSDYRLADIESRWHASTPAKQACLDLLLTAAFNDYSRDLYSGRDSPSVADPSWNFAPPAFDPVAASRAADSDRSFGELLNDLSPPHAAYRRLRAALAQYRRIEQQGGWAPLPPGPKLEPGDEHEQIPLLRARLRIEGDLAPAASSFAGGIESMTAASQPHGPRLHPGVEARAARQGWRDGGFGDRYDPALADAVRRFQRRHGLQADGIVGPRTRGALNVPVQERAAELRRAMERWRWLPRELGEHYILVNTAGFELTVIERGKPVLGMRVIVGMPDQATPSFTATLTSLIINPYWNVPTRIARDALLPRQQHNPLYFHSRGFRVFDLNGNGAEVNPSSINWSRVNADDFGFRLRQEPGPKNSMGRLAFYLPNPFDVFLHDTPERWLFEHDTRTFSEGCVRIENAIALARHTLRTLPGWTEESIRSEIDSLRHQTLRLPEPIPVYVLYLPSWVDDAGEVHFAEDVYGREEVLAMDYPPE